MGAVDDPQLRFILKISRLCRTEGVVEDRDGSAFALREVTDLERLAASDEGARIDVLQLLPNLARDRCSGALRQRAEFGQRILSLDSFM